MGSGPAALPSAPPLPHRAVLPLDSPRISDRIAEGGDRLRELAEQEETIAAVVDRIEISGRQLQNFLTALDRIPILCPQRQRVALHQERTDTVGGYAGRTSHAPPCSPTRNYGRQTLN